MDKNDGVGIDCEQGVTEGREKWGGNWDNCNIINNIFFKKLGLQKGKREF